MERGGKKEGKKEKERENLPTVGSLPRWVQ